MRAHRPGQQPSALLARTITKDTRPPLQAEPGTRLAARIHGAHVIGPGSPAWPRPTPGSCTSEASRSSGTGPRERPGGSAWGKGPGREPNTHLPAAAAAAAAAAERPLDQARGVGRPAGRGAAPARALPIGRRRPRPAPIRPRPLAGVRKELRAHVRLGRPFGQSYVISRKLGPRVWSAVQDCVTGREPKSAHAQEAATAALRLSVARRRWGLRSRERRRS